MKKLGICLMEIGAILTMGSVMIGVKFFGPTNMLIGGFAGTGLAYVGALLVLKRNNQFQN